MIDNDDISEYGSCDRELVSLKHKDENCRSLFENVPFGLAVFEEVDEGNGFVFIDSNKFFNEKFQVTKKKLVGKKILEIFPGSELNELPESLRRVSSTGLSETIPAKYYKDWRSEGWWECEIYKLPNGEVAAIFNDVTALKVAENDLANSEARWRFALEGAREGVWDSNITTSEAYYSPRWKSMLGYEEHEIANSHAEWETRLHPQDRLRCLAEVERHFRGDSSFYESEYRLRCKDGSYKWILARGKVVRWTEDGKPLQAVGTHTDITERKQTERELRESSERIRNLFRSHDAVMLLIEPASGRIIDANLAAKRFYGYPVSSLREMSIHDINMFSPEEVERERISALEGSRDFLVFPHRLANGEIRVVEVHSSPIQIGGETILFSIIHDISERQRLQEELADKKILMEGLLNSIPEIIFWKGLDGVYLGCNQENATFLGKNIEDVIGRTDYDLMPREVADACHQSDSRMLEEGAPRHSEQWVVYPDGRRVLLDILKAPLRARDGTTIGILGVSRDITERKRMLESLMQSEEKLRTIADYTHDWEYWVDPERKLVYVSPSCERITGYAAEEFMDSPGLLMTIVHPDDFSIACNHFEMSQEDDDRSIQFRIVNRSGEVRWISHFCRPVFGQDGTWLGRRASNHDITYEKEMAQELIENERRLLHAGKLESLAVMAGGIAHDFNNQLMALLGNLELALDDAPVGAKIRKRIENAILATDKLTALTHQMLAYTGQKYYRSDDLKLDEIIKDQVDSIRPDTPENVTLNIRDDIDAPMIRGDEDQIRRVLINLVTNAIEAIGDGIGQVNVSSGMMFCDRESLNQSLLQEKPAPGQFAFLQVDDNGCGMDEATRSKIFDPFFSTKFWGRGLGMPEMMGIVRSHKGAIFLNSRPDIGTTVRVIFPLPVDATPIAVNGIDHKEAQTQVPGDTQRQKTILVVEDEAEVRELCIELLQIFGYNTLSAADGDEGVKKFRQHQKTIDLVLLDLMMPQMDGFEAFSQLVQIKPDVKVVISSGYTKEALVNKFQGVFPAGFLHKPYQMDRLLEELEKVLGEPV